jgi:hypothetical protein
MHVSTVTREYNNNVSDVYTRYMLRCYKQGQSVRKGLVAKKNSDRGSRGAWRQDELIGGKPLVVT